MDEKNEKENFVLYTIGFAGHSAEEFFGLLKNARVQRVVDIRLRNTNQIAGFSKKADLEFFLKELLGCEYCHFPFLAPTDQILDDHRYGGPWSEYVKKFIPLIRERGAIGKLDKNFFKEKKCCLLCSEKTSEECHRRLIAEMMQEQWSELQIIHLTDLNLSLN